MPSYKYKCKNCDYETIELLSIDERDSLVGKNCPSCKEGTLKRDVGSCTLADPMVILGRRVPQWFKNRMGEIKKSQPLGNYDYDG